MNFKFSITFLYNSKSIVVASLSIGPVMDLFYWKGPGMVPARINFYKHTLSNHYTRRFNFTYTKEIKFTKKRNSVIIVNSSISTKILSFIFLIIVQIYR